MKHKWLVGTGILLVLFWTLLILFFSSQPSEASHEQSGAFVKLYDAANQVFRFNENPVLNRIENFVFMDLLEGKYLSTNAKIRKLAHFTLYGVLGGLTTLVAYVISTNLNWQKAKWFLSLISGILFPLIIAALDELNQSRIDRTSSLSDVLLDGGGAVCGTMLVLVFISGFNAFAVYIKIRK